jgi:hypothetical protein
MPILYAVSARLRCIRSRTGAEAGRTFFCSPASVFTKACSSPRLQRFLESPSPAMSALSRAQALLWRRKWILVLLLAAVSLLLKYRWVAGGWLARQLRPVPALLLTSPVNSAHQSDVNFWVGQVMGVVMICIVTFAVISSSQAFDERVLKFLFRSPLQRTCFRHLFLSSVKDVVFMFTSRQLVMICSWFFMPPGANVIQGARFSYSTDEEDDGVNAEVRRFGDGKVALSLYLASAMAWYGVQTGLFQAGDDIGRCVPERSVVWQAVWVAQNYRVVAVPRATLPPHTSLPPRVPLPVSRQACLECDEASVVSRTCGLETC